MLALCYFCEGTGNADPVAAYYDTWPCKACGGHGSEDLPFVEAALEPTETTAPTESERCATCEALHRDTGRPVSCPRPEGLCALAGG